MAGGAAGLFLAVGFERLQRRPAFVNFELAVRRLAGTRTFFISGVILLAGLYMLAWRPAATYDEYSYAIAMRGEGFFAGANHVLSHVVARVVYRTLGSLGFEPLEVRRGVNLLYAISTIIVSAALLKSATRSAAHAHLGALWLGAGYGFWKYAASAEVYPSLLLGWALTAWQWTKIANGDQSWRAFWTLSLFANLSVLAHDLGTLIGPALLVAAFTLPSQEKYRSVIRLMGTGLALAAVLQTMAAALTNRDSFHAYVEQHLYYLRHPDAKPGDYQYSWKSNSFIVAREGLLTMFSGIDSGWRLRSHLERIVAVVAHATVFGSLFFLYWLGLRAWRERETIAPRAVRVLLIAAWISVYFFCLLWRPNDEIHHWLSFWTVLVAMSCLPRIRSRQSPTWATATLTLCLAMIVTSGGLYSSATGKLLTRTDDLVWMQAVPNNSSYMFGGNGNSIELMYFRPNVQISEDVAALRQAAKDGKTVIVDARYFAAFDLSIYDLRPWPARSDWSQVSMRSGVSVEERP